MCKQFRKGKVDVCCLQKVRWRGQRARFHSFKGRRYKLWWSGNYDRIGGVGILFKEKLCKKVVEVRRKSDRMMAMVLVFEVEVIRVLYACGSLGRKTRLRGTSIL